jgi:hypothetical protein
VTVVHVGAAGKADPGKADPAASLGAQSLRTTGCVTRIRQLPSTASARQAVLLVVLLVLMLMLM